MKIELNDCIVAQAIAEELMNSEFNIYESDTIRKIVSRKKI